MAEALSEAVAVHVVLGFYWCLWVKLFPEGYCATVQHSPPVITDLIKYQFQFPCLAKHIQFEEVKIWRCDCRNFIIFDYICQYFLLLFLCCNVKKDCENIGMTGHISLTGFKGINKCAFFLIPVKFTDLPDQFLIFLHIFRIFFSKSRTDFRHGLPACSEQHLLCAKCPCLIHVSPINVDPVVFTTYKKSVFIQLSLTELHKRAHFRVNLADKFQVAICLIMIKHAQDPEQGIVHDGIDMSCHRIISTKCQKSSLVNIRVCQQILIYEETLVSIPGPDPFVTFHTIQEKDTAAKTEGMLCHLPDLIQFLITAFKRSAFREIHILVEGCDFYIFSFAVRNKGKAHCAAWTSVCCRIRLPAVIAVLKIKRFVLRLTAKHL